MSVTHRGRGVKVLKAVSSPLRLQILNLLFDKGLLSYTELMGALRMSASRDAGRFAYHLKFLLRANLVEVDAEARKYCLTELGKMVIDVAERIDKEALRPKELLVRTSRSALEEFDSSKIAVSLMKEARVPAELAQKVAREAEKQLLKSKAKYLTAPLVRETVNAILVERGFEEYRHRLARLGVPVHDVSALLESGKNVFPRLSVHEAAGMRVLGEYVLLNAFPRDIADAHLSGSLHVNGLSSWVLRPTEVFHDMRFFLRNGLNLEEVEASLPVVPPPSDLESALSMTSNVLLHSAREVEAMQTIEYFNVFLAPLAGGTDASRTKELLRRFVADMCQHVDVAFGVEFTVPAFLAKEYGAHAEQGQQLASLLLEVYAEECSRKPLPHSRLVVKVRPETFTDSRAQALFMKACQLASCGGGVFFAGLVGKESQHSAFSPSGAVVDVDFSGDWEIDTLRTGCLGTVVVNLPRVAYESGRDRAKFFGMLRERMELASRALEIKYHALRQNGGYLLPFLMQSANGDHYFRLENCCRAVALAGLREAAEAFCSKNLSSEETRKFMGEIVEESSSFVQRAGRRRGKRLLSAVLPCPEASERLARLDIERFGVAKTRFSGTRDRPFYSSSGLLLLQAGRLSDESVRLESEMGRVCGGGAVAVDLGEAECGGDLLAPMVRGLLEDGGFRLVLLGRRLTYCANCRKSWFDLLRKCPSCGTTSMLKAFDGSAWP